MPFSSEGFSTERCERIISREFSLRPASGEQSHAANAFTSEG